MKMKGNRSASSGGWRIEGNTNLTNMPFLVIKDMNISDLGATGNQQISSTKEGSPVSMFNIQGSTIGNLSLTNNEAVGAAIATISDSTIARIFGDGNRMVAEDAIRDLARLKASGESEETAISKVAEATGLAANVMTISSFLATIWSSLPSS